MASIDFISKRIAGKEKELEKLTKKLARIRKAESHNWDDDHNPYCYSEYDLKWCLKDIEAAKKALDDYKKQMAEEQDKAASRNVPAITAFLDAWKVRCTEWHMRRYSEWQIACAKRRKRVEESEYMKRLNDWAWKRDNRDEWKKLDREYREEAKTFEQEWAGIAKLAHTSEGFEKALVKMLDAEYRAKYDWMLEQVIAITGEIKDASCLRVAEKGELNGYIIGEKGTAGINTFSAGGWNIQCFHYRTQVRKIK